MSLHFYDTETRELRPFTPSEPAESPSPCEGLAPVVSVYLCGATVQGVPHLGHARSAVAFDILRRWLSHGGADVRFVRNVTDIDDKILNKAAEAGRPWWEWAASYERQFTATYDALGVLPPSVEPRATGHVTQMVELIERLIARGHAYPAGGDVYFSVASFPDYGALSGQRPDKVNQGETAGESKRDPRDFTLWKGAKPGEPSWPTPWGPGRPGWHLECSAMARTYLGGTFDIHCGGQDLIFPHHENERAQSRAAGDGFARFWLHNGWVTRGGEKMSKSLGNGRSVPEVLALVRPVELRYYLGSAHYRSMLEYSEAALEEAAVGYRRIETFLQRVREGAGEVPLGEPTPGFDEAMDNDLAVPRALAEVHGAVRDGNSALAAGDHSAALAAASSVRAMMAILGTDPLDPAWDNDSQGDSAAVTALGSLVTEALDRRSEARARRDFAAADAERDRLASAGITITDTADGATWTLARSPQTTV